MSLDTYSDEDFKRSIGDALRLIAIAVAVGVPLLWWKIGWPSAALFAVGAVISGSGLFEWLRLMTAMMARMDAGGETPAPVRPLAPVLIGFVLRLGFALALLYVSLKFLHGSVYAFIAGLALAVAALLIEVCGCSGTGRSSRFATKTFMPTQILLTQLLNANFAGPVNAFCGPCISSRQIPPRRSRTPSPWS